MHAVDIAKVHKNLDYIPNYPAYYQETKDGGENLP